MRQEVGKHGGLWVERRHWMMKQIEVKSNEVGAESEMMIKQSIMAGGQIR